ncbi:MAG: hypothetical protein IJA46_08555 [Bacteroidaceae bacterium]|nr:hypothetical protein [Bacteroidaceae bacterium]
MATVSANEIVRYTAKNITINNVDLFTATSKGMALEAMKKRMMRGECVRFAYMKRTVQYVLLSALFNPKR